MARTTKTQPVSRPARALVATTVDAVPHVPHVPHAGCACGVDGEDDGSGRKATAVDPEIKEQNLKRLRRIEGAGPGSAANGGGGSLLRRLRHQIRRGRGECHVR